MNRGITQSWRTVLPLALLPAAVLCIITIGSLLHASPVSASCSSGMTGDWHNIDSDTRSVTRVQLVMIDCDDVRLCDAETGRCTGGTGAALYEVGMFGKCHPTDCDWGRIVAENKSDGWILATYAFGFKTSYVWLREYQFFGLSYLRVYVYNDFTPSDGRADYVTDEWFVR